MAVMAIPMNLLLLPKCWKIVRIYTVTHEWVLNFVQFRVPSAKSFLIVVTQWVYGDQLEKVCLLRWGKQLKVLKLVETDIA